MNIAERLQAEVDQYNGYIDQIAEVTKSVQDLNAEGQRLEAERQATFGRIQILKEIADEPAVEDDGQGPIKEPSKDEPAPE